jgi:hypothetical protein
VWASYLGGSGDEWNSDARLTVLPDGRAALEAPEYPDGFPTTPGAVRATGDGNDATADLTLSIVSADGSHLEWSSYLGGSGDEDNWGARPAVAPDGSLWVSGVTWSTDIAVTADAAKPHDAGGADAIIEQFQLPKR